MTAKRNGWKSFLKRSRIVHSLYKFSRIATQVGLTDWGLFAAGERRALHRLGRGHASRTHSVGRAYGTAQRQGAPHRHRNSHLSRQPQGRAAAPQPVKPSGLVCVGGRWFASETGDVGGVGNLDFALFLLGHNILIRPARRRRLLSSGPCRGPLPLRMTLCVGSMTRPTGRFDSPVLTGSP